MLFLSVLSPHCRTWAFSSCREQELLSHCIAWASLQWLLFLLKKVWGTQASVEVCGLRDVAHQPRCSEAQSPDQGSNLCPLPWLEDSLPLSPGKSPGGFYNSLTHCTARAHDRCACILSILLFQHFSSNFNLVIYCKIPVYNDLEILKAGAFLQI